MGSRARRIHCRRPGEYCRRLRGRYRTEADGGPGDHRRCAGFQTRRSLRSNPGHTSVTMAAFNETPSAEPPTNTGLSRAIWRYVGMAAILAIACILPFVISGYHLSQFSQVLI